MYCAIAMIDEIVLDKFIEAAPENVRLVLLFCDLRFVICQSKKTLSIKCPNSFASDRINNAMFDRFGKRVSQLGIHSYLIDNGEGFIALHSYIRGNFLFVGYSEAGSNSIIEVPLPWQ